MDRQSGFPPHGASAVTRVPAPFRRRLRAAGRLVAVAVCLAVCLVLFSARATRAQERQFRFGEGLTFVFENRDQALAEQLWPRMVEDRREIMARLALHPAGALRIVLAPTNAAFREAMGGAMPQALGAYFPATRTIVLRSPRTEPGGQWDLRGVARHELAHGILDLAIDEPIPRWLNEGLAILIADELSFLDDSRLTWLAFRERLIPLSLLMATFPEGEHALDTAYAEAASFARFLMRRDGIAGIRRLLERMAEGESTRSAFALAYGASLTDLEKDWNEELNGRFSWFAFITPLSVLGGLGAPLVVLGWLRRRLEARRRFRQWEAEGEPEAEPGGETPQPGVFFTAAPPPEPPPTESGSAETQAPAPAAPARGPRRLRLWRKPDPLG